MISKTVTLDNTAPNAVLQTTAFAGYGTRINVQFSAPNGSATVTGLDIYGNELIENVSCGTSTYDASTSNYFNLVTTVNGGDISAAFSTSSILTKPFKVDTSQNPANATVAISSFFVGTTMTVNGIIGEPGLTETLHEISASAGERVVLVPDLYDYIQVQGALNISANNQSKTYITVAQAGK